MLAGLMCSIPQATPDHEESQAPLRMERARGQVAEGDIWKPHRRVGEDLVDVQSTYCLL